MTGKIYNPLDKRNLGESVAKALLDRNLVSLQALAPFDGAGIYAIYYVGNFPAYRSIAKANSDNQFRQPIYVGKAVPEGARKGGFGLGAEPGKVLFKRLNEHSKSLAAAQNLKMHDFHCRYLTTDDIWIPLAEAVLIEMFCPVWNKVLDGFGNHDPGKGRYLQQRSPWDTLHRGRSWADKLKPGKKEELLNKLLKDFFEGKQVPTIPTEKAVMEDEG